MYVPQCHIVVAVGKHTQFLAVQSADIGVGREIVSSPIGVCHCQVRGKHHRQPLLVALSHLLRHHLKHIFGHIAVGGERHSHHISLVGNGDNVVVEVTVFGYGSHHVHIQRTPWGVENHVLAAAVVVAGNTHNGHIFARLVYVHNGIGKHLLHAGRRLGGVVNVARNHQCVGLLHGHNFRNLVQHIQLRRFLRFVIQEMP